MEKIINFLCRQTPAGATYLQAFILIVLVISALIVLIETICETFDGVFKDEDKISKK